MTPKRNRTLNASAGLMTALTVGVASLAGCAPFDPNPAAAPGGQVPAATTPSTAPVGTTPSAAPAGPGTAVKPTTNPALNATTFKGKASINGTGLANADIVAIDIATGKQVPLVAAGSMNFTLLQGGGPKTDNNGNYNVSMPQAKGKTFKLVIKDKVSGQGVSTVMNTRADGSVRGMGSSNSEVNASEESTFATNALEGLFKMAAGTDQATANTLIDKFLGQGDTLMDTIPAGTNLSDFTQIDDLGNVPNNVVQSFTQNNDAISNALETAAGNILKEFAASNTTGTAIDFTALAADLAILEDLGFDVNIGADGKLSIEGNGVEISIEEEEPVDDGSDDAGSDDAGSDDAGSDDAGSDDAGSDDAGDDDDDDDELDGVRPGNPEFSDDDKFSPEVKLTHDGGLELEVTQAPGEEDVEMIVARINTIETGVSFTSQATLATGSVQGGVLTEGLTQNPFSVVRTDNPNDEINFVDPFGGELGSPDFLGQWRDGDGTVIAKVNVYEGDFTYVVIQYALDGNAAVTQNGHTTTMNVATNALSFNETFLDDLEDSDEGTVDISIESREGNTATYSENIANLDGDS